MYQNFFGKDPMKWWIGQVTDPVKGDWVDSLEKTQAEKGTTDDNDIYALRCRVRIVGYHGCEDDLPDKDLPMAHVLLPPNTSTVGGCGETLQYQGGEVVVGFFADGDDAQQPIIFGTLFKQTFVADELTVSKFNAKKQTCFTPYTPPKVVETSGKDKQYQKSAWPRAFSPGELYKTISQEQKEKATNITIDAHSPCQDNEISKISNAIKDFTAKLETLQSLNEVFEDLLLQNAKLVYTNKTLEVSSLNERQKEKIVGAIRESNTPEEAKVVYETLQSAVGTGNSRTPQTLSEVTSRNNQKMVSRKNTNNDNQMPVASRWKALAGIK